MVEPNSSSSGEKHSEASLRVESSYRLAASEEHIQVKLDT